MHTTTQDRWKIRAILFFISQSITLFGSTLVQMAIVWYVTLNTSSGVWVAAFSVCSYLPEFMISFLGGVWADRYHRKKLIIGADFIIAMVTLAMMLLMPYISNQTILLWALLIMSILRSLGAGIQTPAVNAVIPQLVPADQLMRFNGINATMQSIGGQITEEETRTLILQKHYNIIADQLNRYTEQEKREVIAACEHLFDKYATSAQQIAADRNKVMNELNDILKKLKYVD